MSRHRRASPRRSHALYPHREPATGRVRQGLPEFVGALTNGCEVSRDELGEVYLQVPIHLALVIGHDLLHRSAADSRVDGEQVGDARLGLAVVADLGLSVCDGGFDALCHRLGVVQQVDEACGRFSRFGHLGRRVLEIVDLCRFLLDEGLGHWKVSPKRLLKRLARSRLSSTCWRWSSPTGTPCG